eukprot:CAMPEP_0118950876 /NCGR_PEP_ID=MMETSP1169-20130426/52162_1 /TAXON_ID=36882 /ORGANISM="Pyramimonas obovata, Strain CCMP722" /LENGTH=40 /DNA_ID= /DNA_START= /DNA_END= /DNA_ORIENTATION=
MARPFPMPKHPSAGTTRRKYRVATVGPWGTPQLNAGEQRH